ncbi:hypothetical protein GUITHDRAFT_140534 [Guillardia theta CCMP2712]|uniref:Uncharacterized protein n=1 Tax=Guillardia theta (strain CCMP2712) TaxID=905079 RepID=L1J5V3_GUITC|nr:hypothetical protein GUITHDRAFT_140534 [Guillardia theta CCMP2712]EKX43499.1 hypothetical protein GUITHDRAFT_140534 [Guillardia theta CCMP2712]|eukprot:XP_005830479.1 hypothetical protein GUITHDRAFT_140534 [Guillardia theta CCMP2712]
MPRVDRWAFVRRRVKEQLLPIGLLLAITVGIMFPSLGVAAGKFAVTNYLAAGIFFIGGMKLRTEEARNALNNLPAILWGTCSILLVSAVLGTRVNNVFPLTVPEFSLGIALFVCMPCTINSGAALAAQSGGNFALALLLTLISSILGVFVVPFLLNNLTYFGASVSLPIKEMVVKLCTTVLLPLFLGKASCRHLLPSSSHVPLPLPLRPSTFSQLTPPRPRRSLQDSEGEDKLLKSPAEGEQGEVKRRGELLGLVSNVLIIMTPWIQISRSAQRDVFSAVTPAELLV